MSTPPDPGSSKTQTVGGEPPLQLKLQSPALPGSNRPFSTSTCIATFLGPPLKIDSARALEPARRKLGSVESQRVMAVFDDTIRRVQIVTLLPYIIRQLDRYEVALGEELVDLLRYHSVVNSSYDDIRLQLACLMEKRISKRVHDPISEESKEDSLETRGQAAQTPSKEHLKATSSPHSWSGSQSGALSQESQTTHSSSTHSMKVHTITQQTLKSRGSADYNAQKRRKSADYVPPEKGKASSMEDSGTGEVSGSSIKVERSYSMDLIYEAAMQNLALVADQISHSTRNVLRAFTKNPIFIAMIIDQMTERDPECRSLVQYMQELREIMMHKLLTTPQEERQRMSYIHHITKRERLNATVIEKLEYELRLKMEDKTAEIQKRNDTITKLQLELHQVEKLSEEHIRRLRADAEKQEAADEKTSEGKQQKMQADVNMLHVQYNAAVTEHLMRERDLRGKKYKVESEVESWIHKYDEELGVRQDEYEEIDAIYKEEKKQLRELEERFSTLDKEYQAILHERQLARERRQKEMRIQDCKMKAATTIQSVWRSYKVRKGILSRKKKRGGSGGKGKGKKGKGKKK